MNERELSRAGDVLHRDPVAEVEQGISNIVKRRQQQPTLLDDITAIRRDAEQLVKRIDELGARLLTVVGVPQ